MGENTLDKGQQEIKKFLEEQIDWCKSQDAILEKIENKLYKMKELAEYAYHYHLTLTEVDLFNAKLNILKQEVHSLEQLLHSHAH